MALYIPETKISQPEIIMDPNFMRLSDFLAQVAQDPASEGARLQRELRHAINTASG